MHCFICMTYMIFICTAHPGTNRETSQHEKRSLFRDVIENLRIRSQAPEEYNHDENNLGQNYKSHGYDKQPPQLPSDADFIPRRNDRIEMPSLKYRFPKSLSINESNDEVIDHPKEEIVVYIDTTKEPTTTTQKPKKQKRPRPPANKNKPNKYKDDEEAVETDTQKPEEYIPWTNTMAGQSQIGNRDSQMVVKPTVIVNIRGSVTHRDSDIRIEGRTHNDTHSIPDPPQNIFNINQEIKLERNFAGMGSSGGKKESSLVKQEVRVLSRENEKARVEEDMMMCETATWNPEKNVRESKKYENVLQIMFSLH